VPLRLLLHDGGSRGNLVSMADVAHPEFDEVAAPELAVYTEIEQRQFANAVRHLQANSKCPDVLEFERRLLSDDLSLVPRLAMSCGCIGFHDGLQVQLRGSEHTTRSTQRWLAAPRTGTN
jgi:hypothetical protein